jgi:hypothetical protein
MGSQICLRPELGLADLEICAINSDEGRICPTQACDFSTCKEVVMRLAFRHLQSIAFVMVFHSVLVLPAQAERQCNVPAGYYRIVNLEEAAAVELHAEASPGSHVLGMVRPGDIVQSDGTRGVGEGSTWQRVKIFQTEGWILARHLWRTLPLSLDEAEFPLAGWCGSHEPSWSLLWSGRELQMSTFPERYKVELSSAQPGVGTGVALVFGEAAGVSMTIIYKDEVCRDQRGVMSGLGSVYVLLASQGTQQVYSGCCSAALSAFSSRHVPGME